MCKYAKGIRGELLSFGRKGQCRVLGFFEHLFIHACILRAHCVPRPLQGTWETQVK